LPESVRGDPLVAIEIAKIARAGLNTSVMLEYGEIAFNAAPSNAPIGNTYSEILVDAGRPTDAVHVLVEALRQSNDPISVAENSPRTRTVTLSIAPSACVCLCKPGSTANIRPRHVNQS
jgi:hypothetical protein